MMLDAALAVAGAGLAAVGVWAPASLAGTAVAGPTWLRVLLPLLMGAPLALRRRAPLLMWLALWAAMTLQSLVAGHPPQSVWFMLVLFAGSYSLGAHADLRRATAGLVVTAPAMALISRLGSAGVGLSVIPVVAFWLAGVFVRTRRQATSLAGRNAALQRHAGQAAAAERVRIARELHDIVAHGVSLMTIQIAAARRVGSKSPESANESLEAAEETGRQTLSELEGMLAVLRGADASIGAAARTGGAGAGNAGPDESGLRTPLPRITDVRALVDAVRQTGRTVSYNTLGDPPPLPASVEMTVYRVVQEALTNAVRYAGDTPVDIQVIFSPTAITVFVDDEGTGSSPGSTAKAATDRAPDGSGHGLVGMQERLAAVGGTLEAGPRRPGPGWRVYASIPVVLLNVA